MCVYIYIYICLELPRGARSHGGRASDPRRPAGRASGGEAVSKLAAADLRTKILDFGGFDSSIISVLRGGILMSMGSLPEILSQAILAGIILVVGRLGESVRPLPRLIGCFICSDSCLYYLLLVRHPGLSGHYV